MRIQSILLSFAAASAIVLGATAATALPASAAPASAHRASPGITSPAGSNTPDIHINSPRTVGSVICNGDLCSPQASTPARDRDPEFAGAGDRRPPQGQQSASQPAGTATPDAIQGPINGGSYGTLADCNAALNILKQNPAWAGGYCLLKNGKWVAYYYVYVAACGPTSRVTARLPGKVAAGAC